MPRGRFFVSFPARVPLFSLYCNDCVTAALKRRPFPLPRQQSPVRAGADKPRPLIPPSYGIRCARGKCVFQNFVPCDRIVQKPTERFCLSAGFASISKNERTVPGDALLATFLRVSTGTLPIKCVLSGKGAPIRILQAAVFILRGCAYSRRSTVSSRRRSRASSR